MPLSYLLTRQLSQSARSQFAVAKFYANFSAAKVAGAIALANHSLGTTGQWRVRGFSSDPRAQIDRSTQVAVCDIDLAGGFPASLVSCTRSTTATYFDSDLVLRVAAINTPRFTYDPNTGAALGLLAEATVTNQAKWCRDFTNAVWTKTNMGTPTQTATGIDGVANSATRLTASAANATVTQAFATGAQSYVSVFARRVTGSGTVQLTGDNFSSTTNMALTTSWKRFWILSPVSPATLSIKIVTSGDVIELDFAQIEVGAAVTSPIATNASNAQRLQDTINISIPSHLRPSTQTGSFALDFRAFGKYAGGAMSFLTLGGSATLHVAHDNTGSTYPYTYYNGVDALRGAYPLVIDSDHLLAVNYANAAHSGYENGSAMTLMGGPATVAGTFNGINISPPYAGYAFKRLTFFGAVQDAPTTQTFSQRVTPPTPGYDSGWVDAWPAAWLAATTEEDRLNVPGLAFHLPAAAQSWAYWRIDMSDPSSALGYLDLGRVFLGSVWTPARGMASGASPGYIDRAGVTEAADGAEYFDDQRNPRIVDFDLTAQTREAAVRKGLGMQRLLGTTGELLYIWDTDPLYLPEWSFLARLLELRRPVAIRRDHWTVRAVCKELL